MAKKIYRFDIVDWDRLYDSTYKGMQANLLTAYKKMTRTIQSKMVNLYNEYQIKEGQVLTSHLFRYDTLYKLMVQVSDVLKVLGDYEIEVISEGMKELYEKTDKFLDKECEFNLGLNKEAEKVALRSIWCSDGLRFSDRIWRDKGVLMDSLKSGLIEVINGARSSTDLRHEIVDRCNVAYSSADRIVRTELSYIQNQAALNKYKQAGLNRYRWLCAHDERTCKVCSELDGKEFSIDSAEVSVNYPPAHANCRCTVLGVVE